MPKYLAVAGQPRAELDTEESAIVKDILASAGIERHEGEIFIVGEKEVGEDDELENGQTLVYVPPVGLGF